MDDDQAPVEAERSLVLALKRAKTREKYDYFSGAIEMAKEEEARRRAESKEAEKQKRAAVRKEITRARKMNPEFGIASKAAEVKRQAEAKAEEKNQQASAKERMAGLVENINKAFWEDYGLMQLGIRAGKKCPCDEPGVRRQMDGMRRLTAEEHARNATDLDACLREGITDGDLPF